MKLSLIILSFFIFIIISSCSTDYDLEKRAIVELLNKNADSYRMKDIDGIMLTYLDDTMTVALGTRRDFSGVGFQNIRKLFEKDLTQGWEMITYEYKNPVIHVSKDIAWLTADLYWEVKLNLQGMEYNLKLDSRLTAVCKKTADKWKFVLTNFQHFTSPEQALNNEMRKMFEEGK